MRRVLGWPSVVVLASYEGLKTLKALLLPCNWDYGVLDEGQRIRNPDAEVRCLATNIGAPRPCLRTNLLLKGWRCSACVFLSPAVRVGVNCVPQYMFCFIRDDLRDATTATIE